MKPSKLQLSEASTLESVMSFRESYLVGCVMTKAAR